MAKTSSKPTMMRFEPKAGWSEATTAEVVSIHDHPRKEANLLLQTYYLIVGNGICGNRNGGNGGLKLVGHVVDEIRLHLRNFFLFDNLINA